MPWTLENVDKKHKGLTKKQKQTWVSTANSVLKACLADGGEESACSAKAIRIANSAVNKMKG